MSQLDTEFLTFLRYLSKQCPQLLDVLKPEVVPLVSSASPSTSSSTSCTSCTSTVAETQPALRSIEANNQLLRPAFANNFLFVSDCHERIPASTLTPSEFAQRVSHLYQSTFTHDCELESEWLNEVLMYIHSLLSLARHGSYDNPEKLQVVNSTISTYFKLRKIKVRSNFGAAFDVAFELPAKEKNVSTRVCAVLKLTKTKGAEDIIHEIAVGYALNTLRNRIPYFAYMYGGFYGTRIANNATSLKCKDDPTPATLTSYNIQQHVHGVEFESFEWDVKELDTILYQLFLQIAYALYVAQRDLRYMHFDLHGGNVLVRRIQKQQLAIVGESFDTHIDACILPMIIDYGTNTCVANDMFLCSGYEFQYPGMLKELRNHSNEYFIPGYDIYRYFMFTLFTLWDHHSNNQLVKPIILKYYRKCLAPFAARHKFARTPLLLHGLKQAQQQQFDVQSFEWLYEQEQHHRSQLIDVNVTDKNVFMLDMNEWIVSFLR
jgi:hypothetical protein